VIHAVLTDESEALAALYALGSLAPDEARAFERHLAEGCAVCGAQVEAMRAVTADLAIAPAPAAPGPAVRERVLAAAARETAAPAFAFALADDTGWEPIAPGVDVRVLIPRRGGDPSTAYLVRLAPGSRAPVHTHAVSEHCYVISGDVVIAGHHLRPGDFHHAARGTTHDDIRTAGGCLLLIVEAP
jgi:anti-sigma factor ChrR (cupin superfamily)